MPAAAPLVSVLLPVYNAAETLAEAGASVMVVDLNGELVLANGRARALVNVTPKDLGRHFREEVLRTAEVVFAR